MVSGFSAQLTVTLSKTQAPFLSVHNFCNAAQLLERGRLRERRYGKIHTEVYCFFNWHVVYKRAFQCFTLFVQLSFPCKHIGEFNHEFQTSPGRPSDISRTALENHISMFFTYSSLLRKYWWFPYFFQIFMEVLGRLMEIISDQRTKLQDAVISNKKQTTAFEEHSSN